MQIRDAHKLWGSVMAEGSSNTGVVAVLAILVIVLIAGFIAWQGGMLGGSRSGTDVTVGLQRAQAGARSPGGENPGRERPDQPAEAPAAP